MKKNIFFFVVMISFSSVAQVPGYMGKKLSIGYSNYFSPRLPIFNSILAELSDNGSSDMATNHSFNYTNCIDADYILTSKVSVCVSGQFSKMDFYKYGSRFGLIEYSGGSYTYPGVYYAPPKGKNMELKTINFSIGFKFFKWRYENPFGRYRKIEFLIVTDKISMDKNEFYTDDGYSYAKKYKVPEDAYRYKSFVLAYTMGKQRILFDKIVLDYGLRIGLNYSYILTEGNVIAGIIDLTNDDNNKDITLDRLFKKAANARVFESQLFNVHLGLRFLAF